MIFLLFQLLIAVFLLHLSAAISNKIQIPKLDLQVAKSLFPVVSVNIIGLVFNTLCLRDVEASFFQVMIKFTSFSTLRLTCPGQIARGLVLPLTIAVSCTFSRSTPSGRVLIAAGIVTSGFMWGVVPSSASLPATSIPSTLSLFYGVLSSLFIAFHAVLIKSSLPYCNNSTIELAWWTNVGSAILILPFVLLRQEPSKIFELAQTDTWDWGVFFWGSLVTGLFGFLLCIAGLLSIKVTSPITHMFSSVSTLVFAIQHPNLICLHRRHDLFFRLDLAFSSLVISLLCMRILTLIKLLF
jgi:solute carrier family 35 (GDP-fucose transporter), member C1